MCNFVRASIVSVPAEVSTVIPSKIISYLNRSWFSLQSKTAEPDAVLVVDPPATIIASGVKLASKSTPETGNGSFDALSTTGSKVSSSKPSPSPS